jgi:hypothetical protein
MLVQLQVADDLGLQQADGVGRGRVAEARMEFLRHASASNHAAPLQNAHAQPRHAEIGRTGQSVVTGSDQDGIEIRHARAWLGHSGVGAGRKERNSKSGPRACIPPLVSSGQRSNRAGQGRLIEGDRSADRRRRPTESLKSFYADVVETRAGIPVDFVCYCFCACPG